jgi:hypothetical protein
MYILFVVSVVWQRGVSHLKESPYVIFQNSNKGFDIISSAPDGTKLRKVKAFKRPMRLHYEICFGHLK